MGPGLGWLSPVGLIEAAKTVAQDSLRAEAAALAADDADRAAAAQVLRDMETLRAW